MKKQQWVEHRILCVLSDLKVEGNTLYTTEDLANWPL
jgi:hypothetical protein